MAKRIGVKTVGCFLSAYETVFWFIVILFLIPLNKTIYIIMHNFIVP